MMAFLTISRRNFSLVFSSILFLIINLSVFADELPSASSSGSSICINTTFTDVTSVTIDVTKLNSIYVAASFTTKMASKAANVTVLGAYQILADQGLGNTGSIFRNLQTGDIASDDSGIGTIGHIFDVSGTTGDLTFSFQHKNIDEGKLISTSGTLVAIGLTTIISQETLSNGSIYQPDHNSITTTDWVTVPGTETSAITNQSGGDIFVTSSFNCELSATETEESVGQWRLQYKQGAGGIWELLGQAFERTLEDMYDIGAVGKVTLLQDKSAGDYYFRLQHRLMNDPAVQIETFGVRLSAFTLSTPNLSFESFKIDGGPVSTKSTSFVPAVETTIMVEHNTDMFLQSSYSMSADGPSDAPSFDLAVDDGSNYDGLDQQRNITSNTDSGSGISIGIANGLAAGTSYKFALRHKATTTADLTTDNISLAGFELRNSIYWVGSTSTAWENNENWVGGTVPGSSDDVFIPGSGITNFPEISDSRECKSLHVSNGASLQITSENGALFVRNLLVDGSLQIDSNDSHSGSLIVASVASGNITYNRYITADEWHLTSSPVTGQTIESFLAANSSIPTKEVLGIDRRGMMDFSEAGNTWNEFFLDAGQSGNLTPGKGYCLRSVTSSTISFTGGLSTGTVSSIVERTDAGWNCIGNPYSSAIAINSNAVSSSTATGGFISSNITSSNLDPSYAVIYIWEPATGDYTIINQSDAPFYAQVGQAFMIKANDGATYVQQSMAMQTHQPTASFKNTYVPWPELTLTATVDNQRRKTRIKFDDEMTAGLDVGYDAGVCKTGFDIYTQLIEDDGIDFGLQCLPETNMEQLEIQVGLDAPAGSDVTFGFRLDSLPDGIVPVLNDNQQNMQFAFNGEQEVYTTKLKEASTGYGRFTLTFRDNDGDETIAENQAHFKAWYNDGYINIAGDIDGDGQVTIYEINGQKLATHRLMSMKQNRIAAPTGPARIYILKVKDSKRLEVLKIAR